MMTIVDIIIFVFTIKCYVTFVIIVVVAITMIVVEHLRQSATTTTTDAIDNEKSIVVKLTFVVH